MTAGTFVVLEGLDGAGTTTQKDRLARELERRRIQHWATSEPTDGPIGRILRLIVDGDVELTDSSLALLFAADRQEHSTGRDGISERLAGGEHVVCDRYLLSSLAYQSYGASDVDWLLSVNRNVTPVDVTVFVDVPPAVALARISSRGGRIEDRFQKPVEIERVFDNYRRLIAQADDRVGELAVVDGTLPEEEVAKLIWSVVEPHLVVGAAAAERAAS